MNYATITNKQLVGKYRDVFNKHAEGADRSTTVPLATAR